MLQRNIERFGCPPPGNLFSLRLILVLFGLNCPQAEQKNPIIVDAT